VGLESHPIIEVLESTQDTEQLLAILAGLTVKVKIVSRDRLDMAVVKERKQNGYPGLAWLADVPELVADRWTVNYIRHNLTKYDEMIEKELVDRIGREAGHAVLKSKVLGQIAKAYPHVAFECNRQKDALWNSDMVL